MPGGLLLTPQDQTPSAASIRDRMRNYKLETILGAALAQAQNRVRIVTPYFLPDQRLQFAIAQAGLRGVSVEILIPQRCDYFFMDWAMLAHLRFFKDVLATVYFTPSPFNHAKLMTVDGNGA